MPTAKLQPSGKYKVRVYSHTDEHGKQHYKSFTASTKAECEQIASKFSGDMDRLEQSDLTVREAVKAYIAAKEGVLSPSTIREYHGMEKTRFDMIAAKRIKKITSADVQLWISELSKGLSAKTMSTTYGLFSASVSLFQPDKIFRVKLPTKKKKRATGTPSLKIMELLSVASPTLKTCIALAAFCSLRRGEICALRFRDVQGNRLHVHADMVHGADGKWLYKEIPKTTDSDRYVPLPARVREMIGEGEPDDFIIDWCPDTITKRFIELRDQFGLTMRFHDLRAYYASIGATLIPSLYLSFFGGWSKSSKVMKESYEHEITDLTEQYAEIMTKYFDALFTET